jgi:hypothetical protein
MIWVSRSVFARAAISNAFSASGSSGSGSANRVMAPIRPGREPLEAPLRAT